MPRDPRIDNETPCTQDPELWFEVKKSSRDRAKRMCHNLCEVREACLQIGLVLTSTQKAQIPRVEEGIWGGYDYDERMQIAAMRQERQVQREEKAS
jgi:hypothetical protein